MPPAARKLCARWTLAMKASRPSLLKPRRLISARASGRRNMPGLGVAGLRLRRDGAHLDEAEAHGAQRVDAAAVLVQPRGQPDAVGKAQACDRHRVVDARGLPQPLRRRVLQPRQHAQRQIVCSLGVQAEQERAGQGVRGDGHAPFWRRCHAAPAADNRRMTQDRTEGAGRPRRSGIRARRRGGRRGHRLDGEPFHRCLGRHQAAHRRRGVEQRAQHAAAARGRHRGAGSAVR